MPRWMDLCSQWSAAVNADVRGHINDKELVGALELCGHPGWIKLCLITIHYANLAAVFP